MIRVDQPLWLVTALYLRDAAGLRPPPAPLLPRLPLTEPPVPVDPALAELVRPGAELEWLAWWRRLWRAGVGDRPVQPPEFLELVDEPVLRALARVGWPQAVRWAEQRKREHARTVSRAAPVESLMVRYTERDRRRRARPFALDVVVLPLAGQRGWRTDPDRVLITSALYADRFAYAAFLRPAIAALA
ncbi:MAG: hypothetical protein ACJ73S_24315 [Mycobacteriales bacterium]